jgi:hypothetical protein
LHTATALPDGTVLVAGGYDGSATAEVYLPRSGKWRMVGNMSTSRVDFTATLLQDGTVLAAGGWTGSGSLKTAEIYDPATLEWTTTPRMVHGHFDHTATLLEDGRVLVAGDQVYCELYVPAPQAHTPSG